jgi:predicted kinase
MGPLIVDMLQMGTSVVLDFGGNTPHERQWVRSLFEASEAEHILHFLDLPEETCLARLAARNQTKPEGLYFATTSEEEFRAISRYFKPPMPDEKFNVLVISDESV